MEDDGEGEFFSARWCLILFHAELPLGFIPDSWKGRSPVQPARQQMKDSVSQKSAQGAERRLLRVGSTMPCAVAEMPLDTQQCG